MIQTSVDLKIRVLNIITLIRYQRFLLLSFILYVYLLNSEMLKNIVLLFKTNILKYKMIILSDGLCKCV